MARNTPKVMQQGQLAPWLYLFPALILLLIFVVYPTLRTALISLQNRDASGWATECYESQQGNTICPETEWGIFDNYRVALLEEEGQIALRNTALWLLIMVPGTVLLGLMFATLTDRVPYEALAKALIFMPMAISFVGASIIWRFVYNNNALGDVGLLNEIVGIFGVEPQAWLAAQPPYNTFLLTVIGLWVWTGFTMTIIAAALKGIPQEILEAARVDGANELQVFMRIMFPLLIPTLAVVGTTMTINTLKIFDIIWVMKGVETDVLATRMVRELYLDQDNGLAAALAVVLIVLILPVMYYNVRRFTYEEINR